MTGSREIIEEREFSEPEEFLYSLHPLAEHWRTSRTNWVFRGHGDQSWRLVPSALRAKAWRKFAWPDQAPHDPAACSGAEQEQVEQELLWRFFRGANESGLAFPGDYGPVVAAARERFSPCTPWPCEAVLPLLALAQHVGLPTRLLDWSRFAKVAAYFAAVAALRDESTTLEVWALQTELVTTLGHRPVLGVTYEMVEAIEASNPNLHAQGGVFTVCRGDLVRDGHCLALDELISEGLRSAPEGSRGSASRLPALRRFRLPQAQAGRLLRLLSYEAVSGHQLFPGYEGVIRGMKEQSLWDVLPRWKHE